MGWSIVALLFLILIVVGFFFFLLSLLMRKSILKKITISLGILFFGFPVFLALLSEYGGNWSDGNRYVGTYYSSAPNSDYVFEISRNGDFSIHSNCYESEITGTWKYSYYETEMFRLSSDDFDDIQAPILDNGKGIIVYLKVGCSDKSQTFKTE